MEQIVTTAIVDSYFNKFKKSLNIDTAIVGGGPSGLVCAATLAKAGKNVALFERHLSPGGGMWGGAMLFNQIVVQSHAKHILDEFGIKYEEYNKDFVTADSVQATSALIYHATSNGAKIYNGVTTEDILAKKNDIKLNTESGSVIGEMSMDAETGEKATVEHTKEVFPGLFASGMAANAVSGTCRMGPIFGGMLLSGKKAAELILKELNK